jgi:hypothetical protein
MFGPGETGKAARGAFERTAEGSTGGLCSERKNKKLAVPGRERRKTILFRTEAR